MSKGRVLTNGSLGTWSICQFGGFNMFQYHVSKYKVRSRQVLAGKQSRDIRVALGCSTTTTGKDRTVSTAFPGKVRALAMSQERRRDLGELPLGWLWMGNPWLHHSKLKHIKSRKNHQNLLNDVKRPRTTSFRFCPCRSCIGLIKRPAVGWCAGMSLCSSVEGHRLTSRSRVIQLYSSYNMLDSPGLWFHGRPIPAIARLRDALEVLGQSWQRKIGDHQDRPLGPWGLGWKALKIPMESWRGPECWIWLSHQSGTGNWWFCWDSVVVRNCQELFKLQNPCHVCSIC